MAEAELAGSPSWNRNLTLELLRDQAESLIGNGEAEPDVHPPAPPLPTIGTGLGKCGT